MKNILTDEKLEKYFAITKKALELAKKAINSKKRKEAAEILKMAECYFSDANHFYKKQDFVNAFAAVNYAHGWLDSGARLGIFLVSDSSIFTIK